MLNHIKSMLLCVILLMAKTNIQGSEQAPLIPKESSENEKEKATEKNENWFTKDRNALKALSTLPILGFFISFFLNDNKTPKLKENIPPPSKPAQEPIQIQPVKIIATSPTTIQREKVAKSPFIEEIEKKSILSPLNIKVNKEGEIEKACYEYIIKITSGFDLLQIDTTFIKENNKLKEDFQKFNKDNITIDEYIKKIDVARTAFFKFYNQQKINLFILAYKLNHKISAENLENALKAIEQDKSKRKNYLSSLSQYRQEVNGFKTEKNPLKIITDTIKIFNKGKNSQILEKMEKKLDKIKLSKNKPPKKKNILNLRKKPIICLDIDFFDYLNAKSDYKSSKEGAHAIYQLAAKFLKLYQKLREKSDEEFCENLFLFDLKAKKKSYDAFIKKAKKAHEKIIKYEKTHDIDHLKPEHMNKSLYN